MSKSPYHHRYREPETDIERAIDQAGWSLSILLTVLILAIPAILLAPFVLPFYIKLKWDKRKKKELDGE